MRNIKTAIAILVCLIIANLLKLEYPFYVTIATVISMENSVTNSFTAGKNRIMGTLLGAGIGLFFATLDPENVLLCALGIILVIYGCNLLKWNKSISIASIVFLAIMLNLDGDTPLYYSLNRIIDTLIGVGVAIVVNYFVFPPKHEVNIHHARKLLSKETVSIMERLVSNEDLDLKKLKAYLKKLEKYLDISKEEFHLGNDGDDSEEKITEEYQSYKLIYEHLKMIRRLDEELIHNSDDSQFIIYNYHINRIQNELEKLGLTLPYGMDMKMKIGLFP
ncbi:FUSC family protein [Paenibacillus crassostreae]|uniref:Uncharacterized protein n=1 Tax=Paenibacillus crassostreae TaxID=1763538 RepID=A0A167AQT6_9BACL|nr:aromatic acid exporter family protein [Paenibacillus crassostreae]OAB71327.1 hypothetical protein PNBC_19785 [Paenibacillus crassostreae]